YYLLIQLIGGTDNLGKNYFIQFDDKFKIIPWDMDYSFDTYFPVPMDNYTKNNAYVRLLEYESFMKILSGRWFELREEKWTFENLANKYDELNEEIKVARDRDLKRWQQIKKQHVSLEVFPHSGILQWWERRLRILDEHFIVS
ncbi:CotH kinase family protein, partial [Pseudomonadota bacterium]